jgi:hypothetical protein
MDALSNEFFNILMEIVATVIFTKRDGNRVGILKLKFKVTLFETAPLLF